MQYILYAFIFAGTLMCMMKHGIGKTFAYWHLPVIMLVYFAKSKSMPLLPNLTSNNMVLYGVLVGLMFRRDDLKKIKWNMLDTSALFVLIPVAITTYLTSGDPKLAQRETMERACQWVFPYFMARVAIQDAESRRAMLKSLCIICSILLFVCAIECTFRPNFVSRAMERLQWNTVENEGVLKRWGLSRALATAGQPIDLGCLGVLAGTMILILLPATGKKWYKPLALGGILGAGAMAFGCVSMTAWTATFVAFVCWITLSRKYIGPYIAVPILIIQLLAMVYLCNSMLKEPPNQERPDDPIASSKWIRVKIMQDSWPQASTAGWTGWGINLDVTHIGIGSVDNAYLLFLMQMGWVGLALWLLMLLIAMIKGSVALARTTTASERYPVAAAMAGLLAIVFAMYTVWFGFTYAAMFHVVLGMLASMCQMLAKPRAAAYSLHGGLEPHGFPVGLAM